MPEMDSIIESINIRLTGMDSGEDISEKLVSDLGEVTEKVKILESTNSKLSKQVKSKDIRMAEAKRLLGEAIKTSNQLSRQVQEQKRVIAGLESDLLESAEQCDDFDRLLGAQKLETAAATRKVKQTSVKLNEAQRQLKMLEAKLSAQGDLVKNLNESRESLNSKLETARSLREERDTISSKLTEAIKQRDVSKKQVSALTESKTRLTEQVNELMSERRGLLNHYIRHVSKANNLGIDLIMSRLPEKFSFKDIDRVAQELTEKSARLGRVPVAIPARGSVAAVYSESAQVDPEVAQTVSILEGFAKPNNQ